MEAVARAGGEPEEVSWNDPEADWDAYDLVAVRFTWDYTWHHEEFVAWARRVGDHLHNSPDVIVWNADKHYMADLAADGIPVVETAYLEPGQLLEDVDREIVVKPTISGGARLTGRFSPAEAEAARNLVAEIHGTGWTAMVQPFTASVDTKGETAITLIDGEITHVLRKNAVLRPDEVAPLRDDDIRAAEAMYNPDLVVPGSATEAELEVARQVVATVERRFDYLPLYARVDLLAGENGEPLLLELEAVEPNLYHPLAPGSADLLARAIVARVEAE